MKQEHKITTIKITIYIILIVLLTTNVQANSLEQAQTSIDKFYKYTQEQNVDAYAALFDQEYLINLYGTDYKTGLKEVLSYITITNYKITPQYYTESEDSLTYFFNLQSNVVIENEKTKLDNDLVGLFTKQNNEVKLKYVMLQEIFMEQMNREVIYKTAIMSMTEEYSDLKIEAENKDVSLVDYESIFENKIKNDKNKKIIKNIAILIIIITGIYLFIKNKEKITTEENKQKIKEQIQKTKKHTKKAKTKIVNKYKETMPKVKKVTNETINKIKTNKHYQNIIEKNKKENKNNTKSKQEVEN